MGKNVKAGHILKWLRHEQFEVKKLAATVVKIKVLSKALRSNVAKYSRKLKNLKRRVQWFTKHWRKLAHVEEGERRKELMLKRIQTAKHELRLRFQRSKRQHTWNVAKIVKVHRAYLRTLHELERYKAKSAKKRAETAQMIMKLRHSIIQLKERSSELKRETHKLKKRLVLEVVKARRKRRAFRPRGLTCCKS